MSHLKFTKEWMLKLPGIRQLRRYKNFAAVKRSDKFKTIAAFAQAVPGSVFVETGTYLGDMVFAVRDRFREIYSIELSPELYRDAANRFKKDTHIKIFLGDSAKVLPQIMPQLKGKTVLFWLDAHYSEGNTARAETDTPIIQEIKTILEQHPGPFVILIDDARLFVGQNGYPTVESLRETVAFYNRSLKCEVFGDIIKVHT